MLLAIDNDPRDYAWGRRGAISALLGRPATDAVEAELWLGAHHGSPSRIRGGAGGDLAAAVAADPALTGGAGRVPFLLKVIAPGAPLSLQAHPAAERAREGFAREEAAGVPLDAPERNYQDPFPKPELLVALEDGFEALAGLRPAADAVSRFALMAGRPGVDPADARLVRGLAASLDVPAGTGPAAFLERQLRGGPEVAAEIAAVSRVATGHPDRHPVQARLAAAYPGDPGIVISVLLHHVVLARGEAVYLPAGSLHAYLDGLGLELMTASDNVLRGGLTPKRVDVPELLAALDATPRPEPRLRPRPLPGGGLEYRPEDPDAGFGLAWVSGEAELPLAGPAIALCLDGAVEVAGARSSARLSRGEALYASPDEGVLRLTGAGLTVVAR